MINNNNNKLYLYSVYSNNYYCCALQYQEKYIKAIKKLTTTIQAQKLYNTNLFMNQEKAW